MSYFDTINGFIDNVDSAQSNLNSIKEQSFSQGLNDLEDKYSLIKQKALEAVPDEAGDILNYTTQGITALSGTYNTIRALKKSRIGQAVSKKIVKQKPQETPDGDKETPKGEDTSPADDLGLPTGESSDLLSSIRNLKNNLGETASEAVDKITNAFSGGSSAYETLSRQAQQGDISSNSAFDTLKARREAEGEAEPVEPQPAPSGKGKAPARRDPTEEASAEDLPDRLVPQEVPLGRNILSKAEQEAGEATPAKPRLNPDDLAEIDPISGMSPDVAKAFETSADPERFLRENIQGEQLSKVVQGIPDEPQVPAPPKASDLPFEKILPKPPQELGGEAPTLAERMGGLSEAGQEGKGFGLLSQIQNKIKSNPESGGASAFEEAGGISKLSALSGVAELGAGGIGAGLEDIKGSSKVDVGLRDTGEGVNDAIAVKGGYSLGKRIVRGVKRMRNTGDDSADANSANPQVPQATEEPPPPPDYAPLEEAPLDVDARIAEIRAKAQQAQDAIPTDPSDPSSAPQLQAKEAPPQEEPADEPAPKAEEPQPDPSPESGNIPDAKPDIPAPDVDAEEPVENIAKKTLGDTILDTFGAESGTELALDSLGVVGEVAGLGLMLGGIAHDIFGFKKRQREQEQQENQAQAQEQQAEQNLKVQQSKSETTTGTIDLASLHQTAGANASVGIV